MDVCTCPEGFLDSINSLIGEAGALKVSPDLHVLLGQLPMNVLYQHLQNTCFMHVICWVYF